MMKRGDLREATWCWLWRSRGALGSVGPRTLCLPLSCSLLHAAVQEAHGPDARQDPHLGATTGRRRPDACILRTR